MSEQVIVVSSIGEFVSARDLCSRLEEQGLTCWSPSREEDPDAAIWVLPTKLRSARAMVLVTWDAADHSEAIDIAGQNRIPVIMAVPGGEKGIWDGVLRELAEALGLASDWLNPRSSTVAAQPKTHIADDEEEHLEFIAENVSEAQVFVRFGLFDRAIGRLETVFAKAPRNLEAHDELLKIHLEDEEWSKAAGTAADFLDCLRFRRDDESYAILRSHLESMGFMVDDGPPVAVGYGDVDSVPTKFVSTAPRSAPAQPAATPPLTPQKPHVAESPALELPVLRNFKSTNPVFQSTGVESELSGIDFFIDHGMLDEARMRIEQLHHEHPDHPGVAERKARIEGMGVTAMSSGFMLELDDPWEAASKVGSDSQVDVLFPESAPADPSPSAEPEPFPAEPEPFPVDGPIGEGDSLVCTAFVPESVDPGDMFILRVCLHRPDQTSHPMVDSHHDRRESNTLARNVGHGESIVLSLSLPGFEIDEGTFRIDWLGEPDSAEFSVVVPFTQTKGSVTGMLSLRSATGSAGDFAIVIPVA